MNAKSVTESVGTNASTRVLMSEVPISGRVVWLMVVSQMEQTIVNVLTMSLAVVIPLMKLYYLHTMGAEPGVWMQGCVAAAGLTGICIGAPVFGALGDRYGYLWLFRLCAILIMLGGLGAWLLEGSLWITVGCLLVCGLGVGGGYSIDDVYLSELMPARRRLWMIGFAKTLAATGAFWGGFVALGILDMHPNDAYWRWPMITVAALGLVTLLMRIRWWESPKWLMLQGRKEEAQTAARHFLGANVIVPEQGNKVPAMSVRQLMQGKGGWKVVLTSVPWCMSGIGAYGMVTFLPIILMGLGISLGGDAVGIPKVADSVLESTIINIFVAVGFGAGLAVMNRVNLLRLMSGGFLVSGLAILSVIAIAHIHLPGWMAIAAFIVYQTSECGGPGIVTFVLPAKVFTPAERGVAAGISASVGKAGAILAVFFFPLIIKTWGINGALIVSSAAMLFGAWITTYSGKRAGISSES